MNELLNLIDYHYYIKLDEHYTKGLALIHKDETALENNYYFNTLSIHPWNEAMWIILL